MAKLTFQSCKMKDKEQSLRTNLTGELGLPHSSHEDPGRLHPWSKDEREIDHPAALSQS